MIKMGSETKIEPCDICGTEYTKEMFKIGKKMMENNIPCFCSYIKRVVKLKKEIKSQKEEISNLNKLLEDEGSFDHELFYYDAYLGNFNGNDMGYTPDKKYAKWLAKRYGLKASKEGDLI